MNTNAWSARFSFSDICGRNPATLEAVRLGTLAWLLAPTDACYELAGPGRRYRKGFDGSDTWGQVDGFVGAPCVRNVRR